MRRFLISTCMLFAFSSTCAVAQNAQESTKTTSSAKPKPEQRPKFEFDREIGVTFAKRSDKELKLDIYRPKNVDKTSAVLVVHGGAWSSGKRDQLKFYAESLAKRGHCCFAIEYRLAPKHIFPAQIDDCRAALKWVRTNATKYGVDPMRIGAIGYSAGGHLVSLLGTTGAAPTDKNGNVDTRLKAIAAGGAPCEFRMMPDGGKGLAFWLGGSYAEKKENFENASPTKFVSSDDPPVYFFNGTKDGLVPLAWTMPLYEKLKAAGVKVEMHKVEGAGHLTAAINPQALSGAFDFLDEQLAASEKSK